MALVESAPEADLQCQDLQCQDSQYSTISSTKISSTIISRAKISSTQNFQCNSISSKTKPSVNKGPLVIKVHDGAHYWFMSYVRLHAVRRLGSKILHVVKANVGPIVIMISARMYLRPAPT